MSFFTPAELPNNKYYVFGEGGGRKLADLYQTAFLGEIPLVKGISDAGDAGAPVILEETNPMSFAFLELAERVAQQVSIVNAKSPKAEV
jgi:ATP-binding protein involved in chromosome partitioning